jgi:hypothetical protein
MHRHEMQQSNIYLGIYIIVYYFFWKIRVLHLVFVQPGADIGPEGDGQGDGVDGSAGRAGGDTQAEMSAAKATAAKAASSNAARTSHEAENPHQSKV